MQPYPQPTTVKIRFKDSGRPARTLQEVGKTFGHSGTISVAITHTDERELIAFSADRKTVTPDGPWLVWPPLEEGF